MEDDDNELPAVTPDYALAAQGALPSMVQRFSVPTAPQGAAPAQSLSVNPPPASAAPTAPAAGGSLGVLGQPNSLDEARAQAYALGQQQIKQANDTYAAAEARLRASRNQGMSASDLFKLSSAFFTPTRNSSFMGTLANVTPVLGGITDAQEAAQRAYPAQLLAAQQQRQNDIMAAQSGTLKTSIPILEKQAEMAKSRAIRSAINPLTGMVTNLDTGQIITPRVTPDATGLALYNSLKSGDTYFDVKNNIQRTK